MTVNVMHESTLIAKELLDTLEPFVAAYKDERQYLFESSQTGGIVPDLQDRAALDAMDALILRGERVIRRARSVL